jgi:excinuclease ABC subunit C
VVAPIRRHPVLIASHMSAFDPREALSKIPHKPGVYQYYDDAGQLIYIGKAKDLRNRVASYFNNEHVNAKTRVLVRKISDIRFTIVDTEVDAWLLENSLIKKFQPRYNVMLKDDKTYPSICIKNEPFPRIFPTRHVVKDGSRYFGPYASVRTMHIILDMIRNLYPLRTCNLNLSAENIRSGKFKVCLEYQIGNCKGPCEGFQSAEDYAQSLSEIREILKGNISPVVQHLRRDMQEAASRMDFEEANDLKEKIDLLENYQSKSTVVNPTMDNIDVFSISSDEKIAFVNYLKVVRGTIAQTQTVEIRKKLDETDQELLLLAISDFRAKFDSTAREILVPFELELEGNENLRFVVPKIGDKKSLLDLSLKNALFFKKSKIEQYEKLNPELRTDRLLAQMQKDLRMNTLPKHIECFDNSNFQGKYPVSAMVVFKNGKPSKKDYRHFNVKTVEGPNDFATMEEVVYRRYKRVLEENSALPQLILIDGGKGQLSSAMKSLVKLGIEKKVTVIGIAKKLEELFYPGDSIPLHLDRKGDTLKIIQQLRDEAHRFGITFHRKKRDQGTLFSELEGIEGIGKTTVEKLLKQFKSVKNIRTASEEELAQVLNKKQLAALLKWKKEN